ncbi:hypothetical protein [Georgenia alba]|uniref:Uncharacterized protein n=1 Tax=Georgenia alba TaxID=2233858 RepID=A0ABW2Q742_9MICO
MPTVIDKESSEGAVLFALADEAAGGADSALSGELVVGEDDCLGVQSPEYGGFVSVVFPWQSDWHSGDSDAVTLGPDSQFAVGDVVSLGGGLESRLLDPIRERCPAATEVFLADRLSERTSS